MNLAPRKGLFVCLSSQVTPTPLPLRRVLVLSNKDRLMKKKPAPKAKGKPKPMGQFPKGMDMGGPMMPKMPGKGAKKKGR